MYGWMIERQTGKKVGSCVTNHNVTGTYEIKIKTHRTGWRNKGNAAAEMVSHSATDFLDCRSDFSGSYQRTREVQTEVLTTPRQK
jgi:hypothetical protein